MKKKLLEILAEVCDEDALAETDDMDIDLIAEDLIDSMGFVELLVAIEENFGIVIAPSEYTKDEFNTPQKILDRQPSSEAACSFQLTSEVRAYYHLIARPRSISVQSRPVL